MSDQPTESEVKRQISIEMTRVAIALNQERHAYGSTMEAIEKTAKLETKEVLDALYGFQRLGLLKAEFSQEGTAGPIVQRYRLDERAKEIRLGINKRENRGYMDIYYLPAPKPPAP